jgi:hypothetical protein
MRINMLRSSKLQLRPLSGDVATAGVAAVCSTKLWRELVVTGVIPEMD